MQTTRSKWEPIEDEVLRILAQTYSSRELMQYLPGRSESAIRRRRQVLGIQGRPRGRWAEENDMDRLLSVEERSSRSRARRLNAASLWKYENRARASQHEATRRERLRGGYSREAVYDRDGWLCQLCGRGVFVRDSRHKWGPTIDHRVPLARGGEDSWENVQLAHRRCNCSKGPR